MTFNKKIDALVALCEKYQKYIDKHELWFDEPYQTKYLAIIDLLEYCEWNRADIESAAAKSKDANAPDYIDFPACRQEYYELEKAIPPFLASDNLYYYYLQHYYIACFKLLKYFGYTTFRDDYAKIYKLKEWYFFIENAKGKQNSKESAKKSLDEIKNIDDFSKLTPKELKELQAEVYNLQTLMSSDLDLAAGLTAEELEQIRLATEFIDSREEELDELPPIDDSFVFYDNPVTEVTAYRCQQLIVQLDYFIDAYPDNPRVINLLGFQQSFIDYFDMHIPICSDIYGIIIKAIGSHKQPEIIRFCKMIIRALERFVDEKVIQKKYPDANDFYLGSDVELGLPDTSQLLDALVLVMGAELQEEETIEI